MADKTTQVLLISADAHFRALVERYRPRHGAIECVDGQEVSAKSLTSARDVWIDLDSTPDPVPLGGARRVYFCSRPPPSTEKLAPGLFIHKPCAPPVLQVLWAGIGTGSSATALGRPELEEQRLPAWLLDFQELDLRVLGHRCVTALAARLGYRTASLYRHDFRRGLLSLVETSLEPPAAPTVPLDGTDERRVPMATQPKPRTGPRAALAASDGGGAPGALDLRRQDEPCLVTPLVSEGQLWGVLRFSDRAQTVPPDDGVPLETICTFLGRAMQNACAYEQARIEARVDGLTGLFNQRWMIEELEKEIRRAQRYATPLSLLMIDLDGLKAVNDQEGHAAGDCLLRHVAGRIAAVLRQFDGAARVGGDEFVVMLPATDLKGAQHVGLRLLDSIRTDTARFEGRPLPIKASIGAAEWQRGWDAKQLLDAADRAMYCAKSEGRNKLACQPCEQRPTIRLRLPTYSGRRSETGSRGAPKQTPRATPAAQPFGGRAPQRAGPTGSSNPAKRPRAGR